MGTREPEIWGICYEAVIYAESANSDCHWNRLSDHDIIIDLRLDSANEKMAVIEARDVSDFMERKGWSPSYLNLGYFFFYSKFVKESCSTRTHVLGLGYK